MHREEGHTHHRSGLVTVDGVAEMLPRYGMSCRGRDTRYQEYVMTAKRIEDAAG